MEHFLFDLAEEECVRLEKGQTVVVEKQFKNDERALIPKCHDRVGANSRPGLTAQIKSLTPHHEYSESETLYAIELEPEKLPRYNFEKLSDALINLEADSKFRLADSDDFNTNYSKLMTSLNGVYKIFAKVDGEPAAFEMLIRQCLTSLLSGDLKMSWSDVCYVEEKGTKRVVAAARTERHLRGEIGEDALVVFPYISLDTAPTKKIERWWAAEALFRGIRDSYYYATMSWRLSFKDEMYYDGIKAFYPTESFSVS